MFSFIWSSLCPLHLVYIHFFTVKMTWCDNNRARWRHKTNLLVTSGRRFSPVLPLQPLVTQTSSHQHTGNSAQTHSSLSYDTWTHLDVTTLAQASHWTWMNRVYLPGPQQVTSSELQQSQWINKPNTLENIGCYWCHFATVYVLSHVRLVFSPPVNQTPLDLLQHLLTSRPLIALCSYQQSIDRPHNETQLPVSPSSQCQPGRQTQTLAKQPSREK